MLKIIVPPTQSFDESKQVFVETFEVELELEHSLVSLSKWESLIEKPFLGDRNKSDEETLLYIKCMTLPKEELPEVYENLSHANYDAINQYINAKMTATWFKETPNQSRSRDIITAERIYYWMIALSIPIECQHWHLNRLLTLIKVANEEQKPKKKLSTREVAARNRNLNAQRLAQHNTRG